LNLDRGTWLPCLPSDGMRPYLSVITVVRNAASVIGGCIESVVAQRFSGLEYIVIDGASTDGTLDIIHQYGDAVTICVSEPDDGLYDAMNKGLMHAKGDFVHFLNADDRYYDKDTLRTLMPKLDARKVCHAQIVYVEASGCLRVIGEPYSRERELRASRMPQPAMFVPRELYAMVGPFDTRYKIAADYDMVLRLTNIFPAFFIEQAVTVMVAGGLSYQRPDLAFYESMRVARLQGRGLIASWWDFSLKHVKWWIARRLLRLRG
jgi:glycosyltransferase involved in cell wall biosynthesis